MRLLTTPEELENCKILKESWKHPDIPARQWKAIEIERAYLSNGEYHKVPPFKSFIDSCNWINDRELREEMDVLDAGASSGYYGQVLKAAGYDWSYTAMDYSPYFQYFAKSVYPYIRFDIGDILDMPYADKTFKIVVLSLINLHPDDWGQAISEAFRVARKYVIFHRFALSDGITKVYENEAYGVKMIHNYLSSSEFYTQVAKYSKRNVYKIFPIYDTDQMTMAVEK